MIQFKSYELLVSALIFQFLTDIAIYLDIPWIRQIFSSIYLTFIPGFVILVALKFINRNLSEIVLFSTGLSITILMFSGLLLNELLPLMGVMAPLSATPLTIAINSVVLLFWVFAYFKNENAEVNIPVFSAKSLLLTLIPLLSILGTLTVNTFENNFLLLLMLIAIAALVSLSIIYKKILSSKLYPFAIVAITLALLFHTSLITNYIIGWDFHSEYHAFELTNSVKLWNVTFNSLDNRIAKGYSTLSVTILPTIYSTVANIDGTWLFKIFYPLILSFVPLAFYGIYSTRMKKEAAFLAIFFLISNYAFFLIEGFSAKQIIGELFYALLFIIILKEKISTFERNSLFILFSAGLVVSHYSMSYIFLFLIFLAWFLLTILHFFNFKVQKNQRITLSMILSFFTITFTWYIYTSTSTPFNAIVEVVEQISRNFATDFFDPSARTPTILRGLGMDAISSFVQQIGRAFFHIAEFFIFVGVMKMLFKKNHESFGQEYSAFSVLNFMILIMCIIIPNFARYFRAERFYQISLLFLAPFFIYGGESIFNFISKRKNQELALGLLLTVLIPFFLFQTGFIYEVTGDFNYSLPLGKHRMSRVLLYSRITDEKEVVGACWLIDHMNYLDGLVYGDSISVSAVLTSYGMISAEKYRELSNTTQFTSNQYNYIYLRGINIIDGIIQGTSMSWNFSELHNEWINQNILYSNGDSEILLIVQK